VGQAFKGKLHATDLTGGKLRSINLSHEPVRYAIWSGANLSGGNLREQAKRNSITGVNYVKKQLQEGSTFKEPGLS